MLLELVVGLAAIFQYTAAILALRVLRVTGRAPVWLLIAAVAFLMAVRRTIVLCRSMVQGAEYRPDLAVECVGLAISFDSGIQGGAAEAHARSSQESEGTKSVLRHVAFG